MKRVLVVLAFCLLLSGCGGQEKAQIILPEASPAESTQQISGEVSAEEPAIEEVPMEIVTESTEEAPGEEPTEEAPEEHTVSYELSVQPREGLVEDAIGYALEIPTVSGIPAADAVNRFYLDLTDHLEKYTKETVYAQVLEKGTMANVFGTIKAHGMEPSGELCVEYELRVEYADGSEPAVNTRTDYFQIQTGEVRSETN